jgi:hypothetical protein
MTGHELVTLEYAHMKEEQRLRIGTRDNLIYATLGSLALVVAGTMQTGLIAVLLLVAPVCFVLGWTYLVNDDRITAIGRYIEANIIPGLTAFAPPGVSVLGWEQSHRSDSRRRRRKGWQLGVDLFTFIGAPVAALFMVVLRSPPSAGLAAVVAAEVTGSALLAAQIVGAALRSSG